jgi:hypothetical protein
LCPPFFDPEIGVLIFPMALPPTRETVDHYLVQACLHFLLDFASVVLGA